MAAEAPPKHSPIKPCCTVWKEKCSKLEAGRKHLRQAVQILNEQVDKIQAENFSLKKAYEEERGRAEIEKVGKEKELSVRCSFEDEISALKSEISSLKQKGSTDAKDKNGEVKLLQDHLSKAEKEITRLKALCEKEKIRADSEKKNAEAQKKSASEAWKNVKSEKVKADGERKIANIAEKKAEEYQIQLEELRKEAEEAKSKLVSQILKFEEACKKLEAEKHKVIKERKRADSEMAKAEEQRKLAEANEKKVMEEKSRADNLLQQLENARQKIEELEKEKNSFVPSRNLDEYPMNKCYQDEISALNCELSSLQETGTANVKDKTREKEVNRLKKLEKMKERADSVEKSASEAGTEQKKAERYRIQLDMLRREANETKIKLVSETLKFEEANEKLKIEISRANKLSCKLEENRHEIVELQKQIRELLSSRKAIETSSTSPGKDVKTETRKLKFLQEKLKLQKVQLKYAKQMAKLERNRNSILQQELGHIKLDSIQISQCLDALDKWFSFGIECREDMEKDGLSANMKKSTMKRKLCDLESFQMYAHTESEVKHSCLDMAASNPFRQNLYCSDLLLPTYGRNCTEPTSGTHSKLKTLHGGSYQKLVQSSAINSSSASFSDGQLAGSQVRDAVVSTSDKWIEEKCDGQRTSGLSGEVTKIQCNENHAVVAENSVRSPHCIEAFGRVNGHDRKFIRMHDAIESVKFLYSEGKKLHMQMEEKLCVLHGILNREMEKPLEESKYEEASVQGGSFAKCEGGHKRRKIPHDEGTIMKDLCSINEQEKTIHFGHEVCEDTNAGRHVSPSAIELFRTPQECIKELIDCFGSDLETIMRFDEVKNGDYLKLLDLDNPADEECYRRAMEMPLSPTLPVVEISSAEIIDLDKSRIGYSLHEGSPNCKEVLGSSHTFDVDMSSNNLRCHAAGMETERAFNRHSKDFEVVEMSNIPSCGDEGLMSSNISFESKIGSEHDNIPTYCVVFSNIEDCRSISRIFSATRSCVVRCSLDTERECVMQNILHVLHMEEKLLPKEKACALFTLLLLNFSACLPGKFGSVLDKDFILCLDSFAAQVIAVMSDVEARILFSKLCCLDELLALMEDFLLDGQLMVRSGASSETLSECDRRMNIFLDGVNICLSSKPVSADQLVGGSIIIASICTAINYIEFICEASYNLLRSRKYQMDVLLTILHIFANICGEKFFSLKEYSLTMTVLKSIIIFLEGEISSVPAASCHSPLHKVEVKFHPCTECPFDAVSVDMVVSVLLEKLHIYAPSVTAHQMEMVNLPNSHVLYHKDNAKQSSSNEEVCCGLDVNCHASCGLNVCIEPASHSNSIHGGTLCDLSDVLSLVELLACYMSWEWTSGKIIPMLLEILGRPVQDDFAVAVVVLLGQLGRLGVAACGYEDKEVDNLKCKLSGFLWRDTTIRASLSVQIATVASLLQLLSLDFEGLIQSDLKPPQLASQSDVVDLIRKWFSSLSEQQRTLSVGLLRSAVVTS